MRNVPMCVALLESKLKGESLASAVTQMESAVGALADTLGLSRPDASVVEPKTATVDVAGTLRNLAQA